jgi:hypothetical protein
MPAAACPLCRSANVRVLELASNWRTAHIHCADCANESHIPYPPAIAADTEGKRLTEARLTLLR